MNTMISAVIIAVSGFLGVLVSVYFTQKGKFENISGLIEKTDLRETHEHSSLENGHDRILHDIELTKNLASEIKTEILVEKEKDSLKYSSLSDKQKAIEDSVKTLSGLSEEMRVMASENRDLRQRITVLELENSRQKSEIIELKMKLLKGKKDRGMER